MRRHDRSYLDFYDGPKAWKARAGRGAPEPLAALLDRARELSNRLRPLGGSERQRFVLAQLAAIEAYLEILSGTPMGWRQRARRLYDVDIRATPARRLESALEEVRRLLPGRGPLAARIRAFRRRFHIPPARLAAVVKVCLDALRERTRALAPVPRGERIQVRYVRRRPWKAYSWYLGDFASRIEINLDFPSHPSELLHLLAHEAYPGHHAYNAIREDRLVRGRRWLEFSVHPVFSPQSVLAEGVSNVALSIAMSHEERLEFVRDRIAGLAGLRGRDFESYLETCRALGCLQEVGLEAARILGEEDRGAERALAFMRRYGFGRRHALEHLRFFRKFPAYICTYVAGEALVRSAVGAGPGAAERFFDLFLRPVTPSALARPPV